MFAQILFRYREKHQLTQDQLAHKLASKFDEFDKLDCVTFSRWENGRTKPSLKKIFLLLSEIGHAEDYFNYLLVSKKEYKYPILDKLLDVNYNKHVNYRTNQYLNISSFDVSDIEIVFCDFINLPEKIKKMILSSDLANIDKYDMYNFNCVYLHCNNVVLGYSIFHNIFFAQSRCKQYWDMYEEFDMSNGFVHFRQLALMKDVWSILFLCHYLYLLKNINHYENTYSLNFENNFYSLFVKLGAQTDTRFDFIHNSGKHNYVLMSMNIIDFLSNKNILGFALDTYRMLHDKNSNMLNDILQSIRG
ncbi:helix-turn-helix domain-containing protein [Photobacterium damselae]|uniref:helix-turn-helix domain-containing protein n=1 Tax=Photobacterium damselae TaxID=38293 RepID=UPI00159F79EC|nr:helix-turn-helix transcriptional regulator [Photobacterium damselae]NVO60807.1 helix-turn-helix transcriptional regulator [Photobacterium damselae subsp. damselae]